MGWAFPNFGGEGGRRTLKGVHSDIRGLPSNDLGKLKLLLKLYQPTVPKQQMVHGSISQGGFQPVAQQQASSNSKPIAETTLVDETAD
jgi:hypothetical protein